MGSHLDLQNSYPLWQSYAEFIQDKLKDVSLMKAKFEQKLSFNYNRGKRDMATHLHIIRRLLQEVVSYDYY